MKVLMALSEAVPYCKTGGLADAGAALFKELINRGVDGRLVLPLYRTVKENFPLSDTGVRMHISVRGRTYSSGLFTHDRAFFIHCDELYDREGLYGDGRGDYPDNALRFSYFCRAVLEACKGYGFRPDIIHVNDWQTSLLPLYLKTDYRADGFFRKTRTLLTIHNLGYQGLFPPEELATIGVDHSIFNPKGIEFFGKINFLKAGIIYADKLNTVSKRYAEEITTAEYGFGLDGILRERDKDLSGIRNGIDYNEWSPARDGLIRRRYSAEDLRGKALCKRALLARSGLRLQSGFPLISFIGRLAAQKGIDLILPVIDRLVGYGCGVIILGTGERGIERELTKRASRLKGGFHLMTGFNERMAHAVYAGSDIMMMPSRYEPCGLVQMIAQRYGTVPVARNTGGLSDTIEDHDALAGKGTGFLFDAYNPSAFLEAIKRAITLFTVRRRWRRMILRGMGRDFSWKRPATEYLQLYKKALRGT